MSHAAAQSWNAESTDAKGYWVGAKGTVESLDGLDLIDDAGLDVPEFTLSGATDAGARAEAAAEHPLETWEVIDTQIPDDAFVEAPTEEKPRKRKANVLVSRANITGRRVSPPRKQIVVSSPVDDGPMLTDEATQPEPRPRTEPEPVASEPVDKRALAARMLAEAKARTAAAPVADAADVPAAPSISERRALAAKMAEEAKQRASVLRLADHRPPGTLPPIGQLPEPSRPAVDLPESSQEAWGWDEADPLAVPAQPERPSLSVVQTAPGTDEDYENYLATPMPAPPRPEMSLPWPLPSSRGRTTESDAMAVPFPVNAIADDDLPADPFEGYEPPASPWSTAALVAGVLGGTAVLALAGMALVATSTVVGMMASL